MTHMFIIAGREDTKLARDLATVVKRGDYIPEDIRMSAGHVVFWNWSHAWRVWLDLCDDEKKRYTVHTVALDTL
jgi:hypothetical protein